VKVTAFAGLTAIAPTPVVMAIVAIAANKRWLSIDSLLLSRFRGCNDFINERL
jgi:hypothetical protein